MVRLVAIDRAISTLANDLMSSEGHRWDEVWENVETDDNGIECTCGYRFEGPEDGRVLFARHLDQVSG
jgi:hypothetical protein